MEQKWNLVKRKIKTWTRKTDPVPLTERIAKLNRLMRGWVNYFKRDTGYEKFDLLDGWIRNRLRYCIWKSWKRPGRRYRAFRQMGVSHAWAMRYAWSRKGGWRLSPITPGQPMQPGDENDRNGGAIKTAGLSVFQGLLPSCPPVGSCSMNRPR